MIIAHRLATVIDADRILVMNNGHCEEFDHPLNLLADNPEADTKITKQGLFAKMILATGEESAQQLFDIAKQKHHF